MLGISSRTPREFTPTDENLMIAIGRQLANTIEKVRLYQETRRAYDDLTRTQEQLLQSEKMSALGQMISGVAHELNNPLTAILGYAQLLEDEPLAPRHREYLDKIFKQAHRTHRIVQNLLSFARQRKPFKQLLDLRRVLEDTLALRDYDLKASNVTIEQEIPPGLPQVFGDAHQLEQVFLNIVNNALDSMLEGARGGRLRLRAFREHDQVAVEFHDSGAGIRDSKRIFDPFYTTKPVGKGTGLGLSICYGIIRAHGGEILARNHPQGGAVFQVRLPVATRPPKPRSLHGLLWKCGCTGAFCWWTMRSPSSNWNARPWPMPARRWSGSIAPRMPSSACNPRASRRSSQMLVLPAARPRPTSTAGSPSIVPDWKSTWCWLPPARAIPNCASSSSRPNPVHRQAFHRSRVPRLGAACPGNPG